MCAVWQKPTPLMQPARSTAPFGDAPLFQEGTLLIDPNQKSVSEHLNTLDIPNLKRHSVCMTMFARKCQTGLHPRLVFIKQHTMGQQRLHMIISQCLPLVTGLSIFAKELTIVKWSTWFLLVPQQTLPCVQRNLQHFVSSTPYFSKRCAVENTPVEFSSLHFSKHPHPFPNTASLGTLAEAETTA